METVARGQDGRRRYSHPIAPPAGGHDVGSFHLIDGRRRSGAEPWVSDPSFPCASASRSKSEGFWSAGNMSIAKGSTTIARRARIETLEEGANLATAEQRRRRWRLLWYSFLHFKENRGRSFSPSRLHIGRQPGFVADAVGCDPVRVQVGARASQLSAAPLQRFKNCRNYMSELTLGEPAPPVPGFARLRCGIHAAILACLS
jgi:hypothetical protein